jgi:UDP-N-acetylmuramoyl-L-alanyl-D-glutamate--2,6-diaminopimelate ligase
MKELTTAYLSHKVQGRLIGEDKKINGIFNILKDSSEGDVVVRHWINATGVKMAALKGVSCVITQDLRGNALKKARELNLPLILTKKIEMANVYALQWTLERFAPQTLRVVVTGTNGKSTTSHIIYRILQEAGYTAYTNTDSESEFNTLIDPMVAKQIAEYPGKLEALVLEVSEVQGWMDRIMVDHAYLMTGAIQPDVVVLTNAALDHIGLVNSIEEAAHEISGALRAFNGEYAVLNADDTNIRGMKNLVPPGTMVIFYGAKSAKNLKREKNADPKLHFRKNINNQFEVHLREEGIFQAENLLIPRADLPFQGQHFIQDIMAAVGASLAVKIDPKIIRRAVASYQPLKRRFTKIRQEPLIIDDFAHNPDGIIATLKSAVELSSGKLYIVCAIRGSRGKSINIANANGVASALQNVNYELILTSSQEVVDEANLVKMEEKNIFIEVLQNEGINYIHFDRLDDALKEALNSAYDSDTILLIGAQGMDPASDIIDKIFLTKQC